MKVRTKDRMTEDQRRIGKFFISEEREELQ